MNKIKHILKQQGRTQIWLSEQLKLSKVTVANYCNNKAQPKVDRLYDIADVLGVDIKDLLESNKGENER